MEKMCYASYFCELMSYYTREGDSCVNNLNLLYVTFKALIKGSMPNTLIKAIYETRLMDIEGEGIHCYSCVKCSSKEITYISSKRGGLLCDRCAKELNVTQGISPTIVYTLQFIQSVSIGQLYGFSLSDDAMKELINVTDSFLNEHVDKKFKSLEILSSLA